uniref:Uncharacterized protein n=1 Tax=Anguilla anguilla TaxID=7936 RepID=A0A0E9T4Z6_ANGAN
MRCGGETPEQGRDVHEDWPPAEGCKGRTRDEGGEGKEKKIF